MTSSPVDAQPTLSLPSRIIEADEKFFCQKFNQASFQFSHHLADHPLFEIPRLVELARLLVEQGGRQKVHSAGGNVLLIKNGQICPGKSSLMRHCLKSMSPVP